MNAAAPEPHPEQTGDHPRGLHWAAHAPPGFVESDEPDYTVAGDTIKFMWDYGVSVPLWSDGLLPEEPEWLRRALGLSNALIEDLTAWGSAMNHLDAHPSQRTDQAYRELDQRARDLVARLQQELGSRFRVTYKPW